jgi:patatin-like phospholipase/acyl hydrolase
VDEKFKADGFEKVMINYFGDTKLSELLKPCLIATYETELRQTYFFGSHKAKLSPESRDYYVRDVCRATSAAPSYFETARVESLGGVKHSFIDGGIFANNPGMCAYAEVRKAEDEPKAADMFLVSLSTGSTKHSYDYNSIKDKKAMMMVPALIDMMMSGVAETIDFELQKMFEAVGKPEQYVRIEPTNLNNVNEEMDDASPKNLDDLKALGDATAQQNQSVLDKVADVLIQTAKDEVKFKVKGEVAANN